MGFSDNLSPIEPRKVETLSDPIPAASDAAGFSSDLQAVGNDFTPEEITEIETVLTAKDLFTGGGGFPEGTFGGSSEAAIKNVITSGQLVGSFTPLSPVTEFAGEFTKALVNGHDLETATKAGTKAAGIDLGFRVATGGLFGSRTSKILKTALDKLPVPTAQKMAKGILKRRLRSDAVNVSSEAAEHIVENAPKYLVPGAKTTIDKAALDVSKDIGKKRFSLGRLVGATRKRAAKHTINNADESFTAAVNDTILSEFANLPKSDTAVKAARKEATKLLASIKGRSKLTHGKYMSAIDNLDASPVMKKVLKEYADKGGGALSKGENGLIRLRRSLLSLGDDSIENTPVRESMLKARGEFHEYVTTLEKLGLDGTKKLRGKIGDAADTAILRKRLEDFEHFGKLSTFFKRGSKNIDKLIGRAALQKIPGITGSTGAISLVFNAVNTLAKAAVIPSIGSKAAGALTRRAAISLTNPGEKTKKLGEATK